MRARFWSATVTALVALASPANADLLEVGEEFPDWQMLKHTGANVTSETYSGRSYVLWFYPAAMTPGCTAEGRGFSEHFSAYQERGVEVLGVSFDPPEANAAFVEAERFPFPLLSDTERTLAAQVGAADSRDQPAARRISYLVGNDGRVLRVYDNVEPVRHAQKVLIDLDKPAP